MEKIKWEATEHTPEVILDAEQEIFKIAGEARPENVNGFFEPILNWLDQYEKLLYYLLENGNITQKKELTFKCAFEYFNSSSAKYIMDIITKVSDISSNHELLSFKIIWEYDEPDEDMLEAGKEFEDMLTTEFKFIPK